MSYLFFCRVRNRHNNLSWLGKFLLFYFGRGILYFLRINCESKQSKKYFYTDGKYSFIWLLKSKYYDLTVTKRKPNRYNDLNNVHLDWTSTVWLWAGKMKAAMVWTRYIKIYCDRLGSWWTDQVFAIIVTYIDHIISSNFAFLWMDAPETIIMESGSFYPICLSIFISL